MVVFGFSLDGPGFVSGGQQNLGERFDQLLKSRILCL
jgi:hypothetical protein